MTITRLTAVDLAAYRALMLEAYAQAPDAFTSTVAERAAQPDAWWARRLADPAGLTAVFGAWRDGALVGTVAMEYASRDKLRHKAHLIGMYVQPAARGGGAGRRLVAAALDDARRRAGIELVTLTVTQGNAPAQALYRGAGFVPFGVEPKAIRTAAGYHAKVHMTLDLHDGDPGAAPAPATGDRPHPA